MDLQQLKQIKGAIEAFFYRVRFNIALYLAIHSEPYYQFKDKVELSIHKQILHFATVDKINEVLGIEKAVKELTRKDILKKIIYLWIPISEFMDGNDVKSYLGWAAIQGGQAGLDKLRVAETFVLDDKSFQGKIDSRSDKLMLMIDSTTKDWIARTIEEGIKNKLSSFEIAKVLKDSAVRTAEIRSLMIAEQEAALMLGEAEAEVYKRNGIEYYSWITARDELVCSECMANEDTGAIAVGELFPGGVLAPPQHIRCRCMIMPEIPEALEIRWIGQQKKD